MIDIITANKKHIEAIKALAKRVPAKNRCQDSILYYLACTVLNKYSLVALESGQVVGFLLSFQATAQNYLWLHEIAISPEKYGRNLSSLLLKRLEEDLKSAWNTPVKSIKVALDSEQVLEKEFYLQHRYKFTRNDEALNKEIYQKRVIL